MSILGGGALRQIGLFMTTVHNSLLFRYLYIITTYKYYSRQGGKGSVEE